jgi:hypothetical protein
MMEALSSSETSVLAEPHGVTSQKTPFYMLHPPSLPGSLSTSICFPSVLSILISRTFYLIISLCNRSLYQSTHKQVEDFHLLRYKPFFLCPSQLVPNSPYSDTEFSDSSITILCALNFYIYMLSSVIFTFHIYTHIS